MSDIAWDLMCDEDALDNLKIGTSYAAAYSRRLLGDRQISAQVNAWQGVRSEMGKLGDSPLKKMRDQRMRDLGEDVAVMRLVSAIGINAEHLESDIKNMVARHIQTHRGPLHYEILTRSRLLRKQASRERKNPDRVVWLGIFFIN